MRRTCLRLLLCRPGCPGPSWLPNPPPTLQLHPCRFTNETAKFYTSEILLAFQHLHDFNIVYRDLKPENLLITRSGHIKVTDFGFAKIVTDRCVCVALPASGAGRLLG